MPPSKGPIVIRRRLGAQLRALREAAGLRLEDAATTLECSTSKISRLEGGHGIPKIRDVRDLINLYGVADAKVEERLMRLAKDGRAQGWWHSFSDAITENLDLYISLETEATVIRVYSLPVLHGLLQVRAYAEAVLRGVLPTHETNDLKRRVDVRMRRQELVLREDEPVHLVAVIDEAVLHRVMGSPETMIAQIEYLRIVGRRDNIELFVFPFTQGADEAISSFCVFQPRDPADHTVVNLENTGHDVYFEEEVDVLRYSNIHEDLRSRALSNRKLDAFFCERIIDLGGQPRVDQ